MKNRISGMKRSLAQDSILCRYQAGSTRNRSLLRRFQPIVVWLLAAVLIGLGGCRKDVMNDIDSIEPTPTTVNLTVDKAKNWWDTNGPLDFRTDGDSIYPLWDLAFQTQFRGDENFVMVPFEWGNTVDFEGRGRVMLALYEHTPTGQIHAKWMGYYASEADYPRPMSQFNVNDFTGYFFEVNKYGYLSNIIRVNNGIIDGYSRGGYATDSLRTSETIEFRCDEEEEEDAGYNASSHMESGTSWCCWWPLRWLCCPERCPTAGGASDISRDARRRFGNGRTGGGSGSGSGTETYNYDRTYPYIGRLWNFGTGISLSDIVTDPGLNNGGGLNQYFNNQIFQMTPDQMRLLEGFRQRNNSSMPMQLLLLVVNPDCLAGPEMWDVPEGGNPEEGFDRCVYDSMLDWLDARAELTEAQRYELQSNHVKLETLVRLSAALQLKQYEIQYLLRDWDHAEAALLYLTEESWEPGAVIATSFSVKSGVQGLLNSRNTSAHHVLYSAFEPFFYFNIDTFPNPGLHDYDVWSTSPEAIQFGEVFNEYLAFLKRQHPNLASNALGRFYLDIKARHYFLREGLHFTLDICGLLEALGIVCDLANGVFYAIEGDGVNAKLSVASATPGLGLVTGVTKTLKLVRRINGVKRIMYWYKRLDGKIEFSHSSSSQYRALWGLSNSSLIGHHMIPQSIWDHNLIQKAAKAGVFKKVCHWLRNDSMLVDMFSGEYSKKCVTKKVTCDKNG
ncbi:MAG TPA: hypothetical protein PLL53_14815, partial [Saprospiraceae bacterium]|nr:hypothetical protein [Saprospiraceae bacterium]